MAEAALDGLQEAADLDVSGWELNTDGLVVFLDSGVGLAVRLVVDEASHFLSKTVAGIAELFTAAVDFVWVVTVGTLAGVRLEVVGGPGLGSVDWARDTLDGVLVEANRPVHLG